MKLISGTAHPQKAVAEISSSPQHVAIIMDGNGRWAGQHGLPRTMGHRKGAEVLRKLLTPCKELGICYLTLYAFSSENWGRPEQEVTDLMGLLQYYLEKELPLLHEQQIRLKVMGDFSQLSGQMVEKVHAAMEATAKYTTMTLTIALSYGSRQEILHAVKKMLESGISAEELTEESFSAQLYTHDVPDPDLLIRTGGEQRLSNFLLWQSAYTELYFTPTLWPDFDARHLHEAVLAFSKRERRFGHV